MESFELLGREDNREWTHGHAALGLSAVTAEGRVTWGRRALGHSVHSVRSRAHSLYNTAA